MQDRLWVRWSGEGWTYICINFWSQALHNTLLMLEDNETIVTVRLRLTQIYTHFKMYWAILFRLVCYIFFVLGTFYKVHENNPFHIGHIITGPTGVCLRRGHVVLHREWRRGWRRMTSHVTSCVTSNVTPCVTSNVTSCVTSNVTSCHVCWYRKRTWERANK